MQSQPTHGARQKRDAVLRPFALFYVLSCTVLFTASLSFAASPKSDPIPPNLVPQGIPPIPAELKASVAPYLKLGGASFRGWHSVRREILVTTRVGGVVQLHIMTEPQGKRTALTHSQEPVKVGLFQPGTGKWLVYTTDVGGNEQFQLYALDTASPKSAPLLLTDGKSRNLSPLWARDGRLLAYTSNRRNGKSSDVFLVDPANPKTTRCVLTNNGSAWSVSDWSRDGQCLLLRDGITEEETALWVLDLKTSHCKRITKKGEKVVYARPHFAEHDNAIYAAIDDETVDFLQLARIDLATGQRTPLTTYIPWDVEDFDISADERTVAFVTNEDGFSRLHLIDVATRKELPVPKLPGDIISELSWHQKNRELGFTLNGAQSASDAYSLNVDTGSITRWTDRLRKPATEQHFSEPEVTKVKSFDGLTIASLVYRPDPAKFPGKRPVIIDIHGGPSSQSRPGFRGNRNYYLNELGLALVYPNVRGSQGYGRKFLMADNGFKREDAIKDIGAVIDWISHDPQFDSGRIAVMGGSYGGFMTLACLVKYNNILRCGVDSVGIANFATFLKDTSEYRRENRRQEYGDERNPAMLAFLDKISPANHADQIKAPLFIIQGQNDPRVPVTEAERMRDAVRKNGGTVWYLLGKDEGHGFHKQANSDYEFYATALFFQQQLRLGL